MFVEVFLGTALGAFLGVLAAAAVAERATRPTAHDI
jgi:hypothetical protein